MAAAGGEPAAGLSEQEFLPLLERRLVIFAGARALMETASGTGAVAREAFTGILQLSSDFVTFLDDHGARGNRTYAAAAEYAASVRGFANMGRHLAHLQERLGRELPLPEAPERDPFPEELRRTMEFVKWSVANLQEEVFASCSHLLGFLPRPDAIPWERPAKEPRLALPHDLDEESVPEKERWIAQIAAQFLAHKEILDRQSSRTSWTEPDAMRRFVLEVSDEQQVRFFATRIHNLLSRYDTYIQGTSVEGQDPALPSLRRHIVVTLHLLEVMIEMVHFYERHENDVRCEQAKNRIAELVDKQMVLDRILNFCLHFVHVYMEEMVPLARDLVARYTYRTRVTCHLPDGVDLHARPVSLITRVVEHYGTPVEMTVGGTTCYAGSMLQVLMAVGSQPAIREVVFEGDHKPLADLQLLFEHRLGEANGLPQELSYLGR